MKANVVGLDRIVRFLPLLTGVVRVCRAYLPVGFSTCRALAGEKSPPSPPAI